MIEKQSEVELKASTKFFLNLLTEIEAFFISGYTELGGALWRFALRRCTSQWDFYDLNFMSTDLKKADQDVDAEKYYRHENGIYYLRDPDSLVKKGLFPDNPSLKRRLIEPSIILGITLVPGQSQADVPEVVVTEFLQLTSRLLFIDSQRAPLLELLVQCDQAHLRALDLLCATVNPAIFQKNEIPQIKSLLDLSRGFIKENLPKPTQSWSNLKDALNHLNCTADGSSLSQEKLEKHTHQMGLYVALIGLNDVIKRVEKFPELRWRECSANFNLICKHLEAVRQSLRAGSPLQRRETLAKIRQPLLNALQNQSLEPGDCENLVKLQSTYTAELTKLLQSMVEHCQLMLGTPPCDYAVLSLGPLARGEMSLYSAIQFCIILPNEINVNAVLGYFRDWAQLFQWQIDLLGETGLGCRCGLRLDTKVSPHYAEEMLLGAIQSSADIWANPNPLFLGATLLYGEEKLFQVFCDEGRRSLLRDLPRGAFDRRKVLFKSHRSQLKKLVDKRSSVYYFEATQANESISSIVFDFALAYDIDIYGMSTIQIIDSLVNRKHLSGIFGRIWQNAVKLTQSLKLAVDFYYGQYSDSAFIIAYEPKKIDHYKAANDFLSSANNDIDPLSLSQLKFYSLYKGSENFHLFTLPIAVAKTWNSVINYVAIPLMQLDLEHDSYRQDPLSRVFCSNILNFIDRKSIYNEISEILVYGLSQAGGEISDCIPAYHQGLFTSILSRWISENPELDYATSQDFIEVWEMLRKEFIKSLSTYCVARRLPNHPVIKAFRFAKDERGVSLSMEQSRLDWHRHLKIMFCDETTVPKKFIGVNTLGMGLQGIKDNIIDFLMAPARGFVGGTNKNQSVIDPHTGEFVVDLSDCRNRGTLSIALPEPLNLHFRLASEYPLMEIAIQRFSELLFGEDFLPTLDFWLWQSRLQGEAKSQPYPVLVSAGKVGTPLNILLQEVPDGLHVLSADDYSRWFLFMLLTDLENAAPDNFMAEWVEREGGRQLRLLSVNSARAFAGPFDADKLAVKSIIYYCDHIKQPLSASVCDAFLKLAPKAMVSFWLSELTKLNNRYLTDMEPSLSGYPKLQSLQPWFGALVFKKHFAVHLIEKMTMVQELIASGKVIALDLLKEVYPQLCAHTDTYLKLDVLPLDRFIKATDAVLSHQRDSKLGCRTLVKTPHSRYLQNLYGGVIPADVAQCSGNSLRDADELLSQRDWAEHARQVTLQYLNNPINPKQSINIQAFSDLSPQSQEWVLKTLNWGTLAEHHQLAIFKALINADTGLSSKLQAIGRLSLDGSLIDASGLDALLIKFPSLTRLSASGCSRLAGNLLKIVVTRCPHIEEVNFNKTAISEACEASFFSKSPLECKNLKVLNLVNCQELTRLNLRAINLEDLTAPYCRQLVSVELGVQPLLSLARIDLTRSGATLQIIAPHLAELLISEKPRSARGAVLVSPEPIFTKESILAAIALISRSAQEPLLASAARVWIEALNRVRMLSRVVLETYGWQADDWRGIRIPGADLSGANLSGMDLSGANLRGTHLDHVNFTNTNLSGADLFGAHIRIAPQAEGCDISGALGISLLATAILRRCGAIGNPHRFAFGNRLHHFFGEKNPPLPAGVIKMILNRLPVEQLQKDIPLVSELWRRGGWEMLADRDIYPIRGIGEPGMGDGLLARRRDECIML